MNIKIPRVKLWVAITFVGLMACDRDTNTCPNLAGTYQLEGEDGNVQIRLEQTGCSKLVLVRASTYLGELTTELHELTLDGAFRPDSGWYGAREVQHTAASFRGDSLQVVTRFGDAASGLSHTSVYLLMPNGDLAIHALDSSTGKFEDALVAVRQNSPR